MAFAPVPKRAARPRLDALEDRSVPTLLAGLTTGGALVTFDSATPGTLITNKAVTGLNVEESLVGIDYRPANGKLYGVSTFSRLYTLDPATGAATPVGDPFTPGLSGARFGVDFNPAADKLRVVSDTGQNLRLNADTGAVAVADTPLSFDPDSYQAFFGGPGNVVPHVVAAAYTQNADPSSGKTVTTLYDIDANLDLLLTQGGPDGDPSPNAGQLFIVDQLGFDASPDTAFDIQAGTDAAFAASGTKLFTINLTTGAGATAGTFGNGVSIRGLAVSPAAAGAGTIQLAAPTASFNTSRQPLAVTVTRTGGTATAATIAYATADGTAVAGTDYLANSGTLSFGAGEATKTIVLLLPATPTGATADRTFTLTLSNPTGGATLGATTAATVTIPGVTAPTDTGRRFVAGAGAGISPQVTVFDTVTGSKAYVLSPFETAFTGGTSVATGDLNGDGVDDVVVGTGIGGAPRVVVFDGATKAVIADFFAYESTFRGGVQVATGDVNGDGFADLLLGSGVGGGPRVRVLDGLGVATAAAGSLTDQTTQGKVTLADFFAYESTFRGGVQVAAGEYNGDGNDDVVAGSGVGGGPRVRILNGLQLLTISAAAAADPTAQGALTLADYFAYESTFRNGVNVAGGDVNGDGLIDVVTGPGDGGSPLVRAFSGATDKGIAGFFAYDQSLRGGVRVATADIGANGTSEILTGAGKGGPSSVRVFNAAGATVAADLTPFASDFTGGVFVG